MLFNSFVFLFLFLPASLAAYLVLMRHGRARAAVTLVVLASVVFYAYWSPRHVLVFLGSIAANFALGRLIAEDGRAGLRRALLAAGVLLNLGLLGYFKYSGFVAGLVAGSAQDSQFMEFITSVALPIGISFYTFQQIAYLVDVHRDRIRYGFVEYAFFVAFFPQLIAGPIVHHAEIIPQLARVRRRLSGGRYVVGFLAPGIALLVIGLAKKVILADAMGEFADLGFDAAARDQPVGFIEGWGSAVAYALQIYFDFSAYSDMAIGLGLLFGIRLPVNFDSPYKSASIIEFWRRWHMTLSRFLRHYLYIPLGGNRRGEARRYLNLMITMALGGIWHGAGLTFVLWGAVHGALLALNHLWRAFSPWRPPRPLAVALTFGLVILAWVPFRAPDLGTTVAVWRAMLGFDGVAVPAAYGGLVAALGPVAQVFGIHAGQVLHFDGFRQLMHLALGLLIVLGCPNAVSLLRARPRRAFMSSRLAAAGAGAMATLTLVTMYVREEVTFLYFQF